VAAKWADFYNRGFLPWHTGAAASQLHAYLTQCPAAWLEHGDMQPDQLHVPLTPPLSTEESPAHAAAPQAHVCPRCAPLKPPLHGAALEIGCGAGASCALLARLGRRAAGVDIASAAVRTARAGVARAGVAGRCVFVQADVLQLPEGFCWEAAQRLEQQQLEQLEQLQQQQQQQEEGASWELTATEHLKRERGACRGVTADPSSAASGGDLQQQQQQPRPGFDFVADCQAFHVLWDQDPAGAVATLHRLLRPGGLLMLLTGNDLEPDCGPNTMSEAELRAAFHEGWEFVWLTQSRFDETPHYRDELGKRPLAWWALLRRL
jgi:SAM-dependent methyltransferase